MTNIMTPPLATPLKGHTQGQPCTFQQTYLGKLGSVYDHVFVIVKHPELVSPGENHLIDR